MTLILQLIFHRTENQEMLQMFFETRITLIPKLHKNILICKMKKAKLKANPSHEHECKTLELRKYQDIKSYSIKGRIKYGLF